jgi:hypothetical protein
MTDFGRRQAHARSLTACVAWTGNVRRRRLLKTRTRRGQGFETEVSVVAKPEIGVRVRVVHKTARGGQFVFDYERDAAMELGRDLIGAGRHAIELEREIAEEPA